MGSQEPLTTAPSHAPSSPPSLSSVATLDTSNKGVFNVYSTHLTMSSLYAILFVAMYILSHAHNINAAVSACVVSHLDSVSLNVYSMSRH